ncbi:hypothetical protein HOY80DRAFT_892533 [Tuber brumale]|nr:hypothetical protein HOY80DRAFT_892533 [Tuber brumale]
MRILYEEGRSKGRENRHYRLVMEWSTDFQRKRPPSDDLLEEQPLSKRLEKLSLVKKVELLNKPRPFPTTTPASGAPLPQPEAERMDVDNVVFIKSLDEEIASCDSEDDPDSRKLIFLPDVDKQLTRVPYLLAKSGARSDGSGGGETSTDLVLYSVPSSLSVSEERDNVRRAIIEARNRIRKRQADEAAAAVAQAAGMAMGGEGEKEEEEEEGYEWDSMEMGGDIARGRGFYEDPDAMDIG